MTAIEISEPGGPQVLKPVTRPVPTPGPGEVLIKVAAAGINRPSSCGPCGEEYLRNCAACPSQFGTLARRAALSGPQRCDGTGC